MLTDNAILGLFPLLLTEYGLLTRRTTVERLTGKWRPVRTMLRLMFWLALWAHAGADPSATFRVGIGFVLGELGAIALRRRMRIDIGAGRAHGLPITHLIPVAVGALFALAMLAGSRLGPGEFQIPRPGARPMVVAAGLFGLWSWATMLTVGVIDLARPEEVTNPAESSIGAGELIGLLERLITYILVLNGALPAVGFVIAAKAAARYPQFKQKAFAEYFLIGTLTSAGLAVLFGTLAAGA